MSVGLVDVSMLFLNKGRKPVLKSSGFSVVFYEEDSRIMLTFLR